MKPLSILIVLFIIGCAGATVKEPGIKPPVLSEKEKEVLMQVLKVGVAVGSSVLLYKAVK